MEGITELSFLLTDLFTARHVAEEIYRRGDRHAALEAICRSRASVNPFYRLRLVLNYLSVRVAYNMSLGGSRQRAIYRRDLWDKNVARAQFH